MTSKLPSLVSNYIANVMPSMQGWCSTEKATALAEVILEQRPLVTVEIGVFAGRSLLAMALAMHENGFGQAIGIDPWSATASISGFEGTEDTAKQNREWWAKVDHLAIHRECIQYMKALNVERYVKLVKATSAEAKWGFDIAFAVNRNQPFIDVLHIDGNHSEEHALYDADNYVPLVAPGGIVIFDDLNWETTKLGQQRVLEMCDLVRKIETEGQVCGIFKRR